MKLTEQGRSGGRWNVMLEDMDRRGRSDLMYAKVKLLSKKDTTSNRSATINDSNGQLLTEPERIRDRWKEYIEILYDKDGKPKTEDVSIEEEEHVLKDDLGPELLDSEVKAAIKEMKNKKAEGLDGTPAEF